MVPKDFLFKLAVLGISLGASLGSILGSILGVSLGASPSDSIGALFLLFIPLAFILGIITLICLFLHFIRPNMVISIKNKMGSGEGPVDIRRKTIKSDSTGFAEVIPTEETEGAIREIGAIIKDIQTLGDLGLQKWMNMK